MKQSFKEFYLEKRVLGIEEDITIPEIGTISAKLDTGNGGYNVLHATEIQPIGNNIIRFNTVNDIKLEKTMSEMIKINVGGGNSEDRPVVMFNVSMGSDTYKNVPFSLSDRSENAKKALISKTFIQNDLNALIDVAKTNNASENEEVK
jgi:hypothetical protein